MCLTNYNSSKCFGVFKPSAVNLVDLKVDVITGEEKKDPSCAPAVQLVPLCNGFTNNLPVSSLQTHLGRINPSVCFPFWCSLCMLFLLTVLKSDSHKSLFEKRKDKKNSEKSLPERRVKEKSFIFKAVNPKRSKAFVFPGGLT